jgi:D-alanyl-lipoteichoic acid acyltransferase DltB (MBOAT superfamily)
MLFQTFEFLVFLMVVAYLYYHLARRHRLILLVLASYLFYWVWSVKYSILMLASTALDYFMALLISRSNHPGHRRLFLLGSVAGNLGLLGYFKYTNFALQSLQASLAAMGLPVSPLTLHVILPLGISFYTFQEMSYTIDVYRGQTKVCRDPITMAAFVSFFPHLVAGPIMRSSSLIPQIEKEPEYDWANVRDGINLILWGLFKKVVLADPIGAYADVIFGAPQRYSGFGMLLGVYAFAFQIYFDFSAYSQIAMGAARLMGIHLIKNFDLPYMATDISNFWRRWHISLSNWLRDYLYIPLGGSQRGAGRTYVNLLVTMTLGGLWHGANWTFVVWGAYHGALLAITRLAKERAPGVFGYPQLEPLLVFLNFHLVCVGWIFFRCASLSQVRLVFARFAAWKPAGLDGELAWLAILIALAITGQIAYRLARERLQSLCQAPSRSLEIAYICSMLVLLAAGGAAGVAKFIYFEF